MALLTSYSVTWYIVVTTAFGSQWCIPLSAITLYTAQQQLSLDTPADQTHQQDTFVCKRAFLLQIVVFGRSLGGAVAFNLAATNPGAINSLIVENTFWSIEAVTGKVSMVVLSCFPLHGLVTFLTC